MGRAHRGRERQRDEWDSEAMGGSHRKRASSRRKGAKKLAETIFCSPRRKIGSFRENLFSRVSGSVRVKVCTCATTKVQGSRVAPSPLCKFSTLLLDPRSAFARTGGSTCIPKPKSCLAFIHSLFVTHTHASLLSHDQSHCVSG